VYQDQFAADEPPQSVTKVTVYMLAGLSGWFFFEILFLLAFRFFAAINRSE
jgi:hypothetical protein